MFSSTFSLLLFSVLKSVNSQCSPWSHHFADGLGPFTINGNAEVSNGLLRMKMNLGETPNEATGVIMGYGARIDSTQPIHYGRYAAKMRASALPGCVTGFVMMSPGKDEIDFEWVGKNAATTQTNYYVKGLLDYTKGFIANNGYDISQSFHEYAVDWQPDHISWFIDGNLIRTVDTSSNIGLPAEPGNLIFSLWDGGAGLPGTSDWAGGKINWNSPLLDNGATYSEIEYVSYTC